MVEKWKTEEELQRFVQLWDEKPLSGMCHTQEMWDIRADNWEEKLQKDRIRKEASDRRIDATARFLRERGLLGANDDVIDIGCGPGRFVEEFAKTVKLAVGTDLSPRMLEHAGAFAASQGKNNVSFTPCDFKKVDIDDLGWRKAFDLVFTSITPAVSRKKEVDKVMEMSRAWCFNSSFINVEDSLLTEISKNVFEKEPFVKWDGRVFYALFNILWLQGFNPYVTYYTEKSQETLEAGMALAERAADNLRISLEDKDAIEKIYRYVMENADKDGNITYHYESTYVWMLWDVRTQMKRNF